MSIVVDSDRIVVAGIARVEDAEPLANALLASRHRTVDLSDCIDLHGAVLQVLLAFSPKVAGCVGNPSLETWLAPIVSPKFQAKPET